MEPNQPMDTSWDSAEPPEWAHDAQFHYNVLDVQLDYDERNLDASSFPPPPEGALSLFECFNNDDDDVQGVPCVAVEPLPALQQQPVPERDQRPPAAAEQATRQRPGRRRDSRQGGPPAQPESPVGPRDPDHAWHTRERMRELESQHAARHQARPVIVGFMRFELDADRMGDVWEEGFNPYWIVLERYGADSRTAAQRIHVCAVQTIYASAGAVGGDAGMWFTIMCTAPPELNVLFHVGDNSLALRSFRAGDVIPFQVAMDNPQPPFESVRVTCGIHHDTVAHLNCVRLEMGPVTRNVKGGHRFSFKGSDGVAEPERTDQLNMRVAVIKYATRFELRPFRSVSNTQKLQEHKSVIGAEIWLPPNSQFVVCVDAWAINSSGVLAELDGANQNPTLLWLWDSGAVLRKCLRLPMAETRGAVVATLPSVVIQACSPEHRTSWRCVVMRMQCFFAELVADAGLGAHAMPDCAPEYTFILCDSDFGRQAPAAGSRRKRRE